jgi:predicted murein hydrolase (TIGR00659 family)
MSGPVEAVRVFLAASPLTWLALTLAAYLVGVWLQRRADGWPLINPVLIAILLIAGLLTATGSDYRTYFDGAQFVHFLLGPATVALAVPLWRHSGEIRRAWPALALALVAGAITAAASAVAIARAMGATPAVVASLAPKSVTTPIAMGIAEHLGGVPPLTAVLVIVTGIVGAVFGQQLLAMVRVTDPRATGFALGVASHGIGTARAFGLGSTAGAFAGLGMGLNGLLTACLLPYLFRLLG